MITEHIKGVQACGRLAGRPQQDWPKIGQAHIAQHLGRQGNQVIGVPGQGLFQLLRRFGRGRVFRERFQLGQLSAKVPFPSHYGRHPHERSCPAIPGTGADRRYLSVFSPENHQEYARSHF